MLDARSFRRRLGLLGLASLSVLLPLACAPDLKGGQAGSGGAGSGGAGGGPAMCGNGVLEEGEDCDDGNQIPGDGCTSCMACNGEDEFLSKVTWHCYTLVKDEKSWLAARDDCKTRGGDLAGISTPAELADVNANTTADVWIGGNDQQVECAFTWANGEPWYANWESGEPNDVFDEDCVVLRGETGKYNDASCADTRAYLCERAPEGSCGDAIVQPGEECDDGNEAAGDGCDACLVECAADEAKNPVNLHCYRFVTKSDKAWSGAKSDCSGDSHLATVNTPQEAAFLAHNLQGKTWIGMKKDDKGWIWVNGEPSCWTNWSPDQPSSTLGEYCVEAVPASMPDAQWNNAACDNLNDYVCERAPLGK